jgi:hypothetical protein
VSPSVSKARKPSAGVLSTSGIRNRDGCIRTLLVYIERLAYIGGERLDEIPIHVLHFAY